MKLFGFIIMLYSGNYIITSKQIEEKYTFLPITSSYCKHNQDLVDFSITQHMNFVSGKYNSSKGDISHVCNVRVRPSGRIVDAISNNNIIGSFWHPRFRIDIEGCGSFVEITYMPDSFQTNLLNKSENITCYHSMPYIVDADHRQISFKLHINEGKRSHVEIDLSSYLRYNSEYSLDEKKSACDKNLGFWCSNKTQICLNNNMICDFGDGCFDGGSDEKNCPNKTVESINSFTKYNGDTWSPYIPWTATLLVLIPVLVILILRLFTVHKRSFGDFDSLSQNDLDPTYLSNENKNGNMENDEGFRDDKSSNQNFDNDDSDFSMEKTRSIYLPPSTDAYKDSGQYSLEDEERKPLNTKVPILINSNLNIIKEDAISNSSLNDGKHVHYEKHHETNPDYEYIYGKRISDDSTISKGESGFLTDSSSGTTSIFDNQKYRNNKINQNQQASYGNGNNCIDV